jgi:pilus assembly protein CpaE
MQRNVLIVSRERRASDWLADGLDQAGIRYVMADPPTLEKVLQIVDLATVDEIFVYIGADQDVRDAALIEGVVAAKPMMPVIAIGETADQHSLLLAMRAGARDFLGMDSRSGELMSLLGRIKPREQLASSQSDQAGKIFAVLDGRPGYGAALLATHLALEMQRGAATLLLDLGAPHGDSALCLGLDNSYNFIDALRSIRRLDSKLIETGFPQHRSGLTLLSLPEESWGGEEISTADVYLLICALRRHFPRIVVNLGGLPKSELLLMMLNNADAGVMLAEQNLLSCRGNALLLDFFRENRADTTKIGLVIDRYTRKIPMTEADMSKTFGLRISGTLPSSGLMRVASINAKSPISVQRPDDEYTRAVVVLTGKLFSGMVAAGGRGNAAPPSAVRSLFGKLVSGKS